MNGEPEYITWEEPWSGRDVRPDFRKAMTGTMVTRAVWRCPGCHGKFPRRKPCAHHMIECPDLWHELDDNDMAMAIRAAWALFQESMSIPNRMAPDSFDQRIKNTGAEVALARILQAQPSLRADDRAYLEQHYDPIHQLNTFGKVPDIPIGRGIEGRQSDTHDLIFRDHDHKQRIYAKMVGEFPRYGFDGWLVPAEWLYDRWRQTYGKTNVPPCYGFPRSIRNARIEELIEVIHETAVR